ncbi:hypothetical protein [Weissella cibaria]|nr:hypothetical protein [Weissella cibaria]
MTNTLIQDVAASVLLWAFTGDLSDMKSLAVHVFVGTVFSAWQDSSKQ